MKKKMSENAVELNEAKKKSQENIVKLEEYQSDADKHVEKLNDKIMKLQNNIDIDVKNRLSVRAWWR